MRMILSISLTLLLVTACGSNGEDDSMFSDGTIDFARWSSEAGIDPSAFDAVAFMMDGTCHSCQTKFEAALAKSTRRVLCVTCDATTVSKYQSMGMRVYYDSSCRMEYLDFLSRQTTVVYPKSPVNGETVMVINPETIGSIVLWLEQ